MDIKPFFEDDQHTLDSQWQRVAAYKPKLSKHIEISFHKFRGSRWYVLLDPARKQSIRVNQRSFEFIRHLDGGKSVENIWQLLSLDDNCNNYDKSEIIDLLSSLIQHKIVEPGVNITSLDFIKQKQKEHNLKSFLDRLNPLAVKVPLFNPDNFFSLALNKFGFLFSPYIISVGIAFLTAVFVFGLLNLNVIQSDVISSESYITNNIGLLIFSYIILKFIHELAHGMSLKYYGLSSNELGVTFMVFMPIPYVDASNVWSLNDKWRRIVISLAGIYAELIVSSIALFLYFLVSDQHIKSMCLSVAIVGLSSSILFNANPLLKFDGYYALEDFVEIPDLYERSKKYCLMRYKSLLFSIPYKEDLSSGESLTLIIFAHASTIYRYILSFIISVYLIENLFFIGALLSLYMLYQLIYKRISGFIRFLMAEVFASKYQNVAALRLIPLLIASVFVLFWLPVKSSKTIEGVSWLDEKSKVVIPESALLKKSYKEFGEKVSSGDLLFSLDPMLEQSNISLHRAELTLLETDFFSAIRRREINQDFDSEREAKEEKLKSLKEKITSFELKSNQSGILVPADVYQVESRWVKKGQVVAYVINRDETVIRAVISQDHLEAIEQGVEKVEVVFSGQPFEIYTAKLKRVLPRASKELPHPALAIENGGKFIASLSNDGEKFIVEKEVVILEFETEKFITANVGERAYVRIVFGETTIYESLRRTVYQIFSEALLTI